MVAFDLGMQTNDAVLREVLRVELKDEASCDIGRQISVYVNVPQLYPIELWPVKESQTFLSGGAQIGGRHRGSAHKILEGPMYCQKIILDNLSLQQIFGRHTYGYVHGKPC